MTEPDPPRLLDDPSTPDDVRAALRSFEQPAPPYDPSIAARSAARVAAIGVTAGVTPLVKIIALSALALAVALPAAKLLRDRRAIVSSQPPVTRVAVAPVAARVAATTPDPAPAAQPALAAPASVAPPPSRPRSSPPPTVSARAERDLLADAQRALERDGDARRALSLVSEHRHRFSRSPLDEERHYLALRAYARLGDRASLEREGALFLQRFSGSIYGSAARRLLGARP
jgi:hypothetical protein